MGKLSPTGQDLAVQIAAAALAAANASTTPTAFVGHFNASVGGTFSGTVTLEKSFDGGATFVPAINEHTGEAITFTTAGAIKVCEPEPGVLYQLAMTAFTSGTANARLSQGAGNGPWERLS